LIEKRSETQENGKHENNENYAGFFEKKILQKE